MTKIAKLIIRQVQGLRPESKDFLLGMALAFDPLPDHEHHYRLVDGERALAADWKLIGNDLKYVIARNANERTRQAR